MKAEGGEKKRNKMNVRTKADGLQLRRTTCFKRPNLVISFHIKGLYYNIQGRLMLHQSQLPPQCQFYYAECQLAPFARHLKGLPH